MVESVLFMLNIGSMSTGARVMLLEMIDKAKLQSSPVCTSKGEKIAISRRVEKHWRLIGWARSKPEPRLKYHPAPFE